MTGRLHTPALLTDTLRLLAPAPGKRIVDGTFGFGGHTTALLAAGATVLGLDLDDEAAASCRQLAQGQPGLICHRGSFRDLAAALAAANWDGADGLLLDLGVSSRQLDDPTKGFSYRADGPLDLRFDQHLGRPAHALLEDLDETELTRVLRDFAEERGARPLARAIKGAGRTEPIRTTARLRDVVTAALPHGAPVNAVLSRVFQALRIAVNDELAALAETLDHAPQLLGGGARIVVIAYHSLEDRIVKQWIERERHDCLCPADIPVCRCGHQRTLVPLTRRPITASDDEVRDNTRARSARLRAAELLAA
jgi:16S rRNA (cytosine1402-N4)-methyltransferase